MHVVFQEVTSGIVCFKKWTSCTERGGLVVVWKEICGSPSDGGVHSKSLCSVYSPQLRMKVCQEQGQDTAQVQGCIVRWFVNGDSDFSSQLVNKVSMPFFSWTLCIAELCCIRYFSKVIMAYGKQNWSFLLLGKYVSVHGWHARRAAPRVWTCHACWEVTCMLRGNMTKSTGAVKGNIHRTLQKYEQN